ncbi:MAG: RsiV family protein [Spirochaetaceae bacterium]|jgi:hypothetical protein|nr:RsiV family protein [Spirochaetaceae bacterium]
MTKNLLRCAGAVTLALGAALLCGACASTEGKTTTEDKAAIEKTTRVDNKNGYTLVITERAPPPLEGEDGLSKVITIVGKAMFSLFEDEVRRNDEAVKKAEGRGFPPDREFPFSVDYQEGRNDGRLYSVLLIYEWNAGLAHGSSLPFSILWDKKADNVLGLKDVLPLAGFSSLEDLSEKARASLENNINPGGDPELSAMIRKGTAPDSTKFNVFLLEDSRITFYFHQYQVGPGALGIQSVSFPVKQARR